MALFRLELLVPHAKYPSLATEGAAAYDLHSAYPYTLDPGKIIAVDTGLRMEYLTSGYALLVCSRSSMAFKGIVCTNSPGIIDCDYDGPVKVILGNIGDTPYKIAVGDRIAQLMPYRLVDDFDIHDVTLGGRKLVRQNPVKRTGGFGSTGT